MGKVSIWTWRGEGQQIDRIVFDNLKLIQGGEGNCRAVFGGLQHAGDSDLQTERAARELSQILQILGDFRAELLPWIGIAEVEIADAAVGRRRDGFHRVNNGDGLPNVVS